MATETTDYPRVLEFICRLASREVCDPLRRDALVSSLTLGLSTTAAGGADSEAAGLQVFTSGWPETEGAMLLQPGPEPAEQRRAAIAARSVRALRDLLLAFPSGRLGLFSLSGAWMVPRLAELFEERAGDSASPGGSDQGDDANPIPSFIGVKRGSGRSQRLSASQSFGQVSGSKDPVLAQFRDLTHAAGRRGRGQFVVEGLTLVQRAVGDGLPVDAILYTPEFARDDEGVRLLGGAARAGIRHHLLTEGLMGKVTTTRPVPIAVAAVHGRLPDALTIDPTLLPTLLLADNVNNPENLGMVLRTADAAGVGGVVILGEASDPFHKHCLRAARGAVGRIPLFSCSEPLSYLQHLRRHSFRIVGATGQGESDLYRCALQPPLAAIVGNEQEGISPALLEACTDRVRIPMAPGQDSLNVGVAAGVFLYELLRQRLDASTPRPMSDPNA